MKAIHSHRAIADQIQLIQVELDELRSMLTSFDPSLPPDTISADWISGILKARRRRERIFGEEMFSDPAWDILLALYSVELANESIILSDLCRALPVAGTTALRWVVELERLGLVARTKQPGDRKRVVVKLSSRGVADMSEYFREPGSAAVAV